MTADEWTDCPKCGARLKASNVDEHMEDVHPGGATSEEERRRVQRRRRRLKRAGLAVLGLALVAAAVVAAPQVADKLPGDSGQGPDATVEGERVVTMKVGCGGCGNPCKRSCPGCDENLAQGAREVEGVSDAFFDPEGPNGKGRDGVARVGYDPDQVSLETIKDAIRDTPPYPMCCDGLTVIDSRSGDQGQGNQSDGSSENAPSEEASFRGPAVAAPTLAPEAPSPVPSTRLAAPTFEEPCNTPGKRDALDPEAPRGAEEVARVGDALTSPIGRRL